MDTRSSTVEWALAEQVKDPDVLKKLHREVDNVMGKDCLMAESYLPRLTFLAADIPYAHVTTTLLSLAGC